MKISTSRNSPAGPPKQSKKTETRTSTSYRADDVFGYPRQTDQATQALGSTPRFAQTGGVTIIILGEEILS